MSKLIIGTLIAIVAASLSVPVFAHDNHDHSSEKRDSNKHSRDHRNFNHGQKREAHDSERSTVRQMRNAEFERKMSHSKQIELHRSELKKQVEAKRGEHKVKLADTRLQQCMKRQDKINAFMHESGRFGRQKLSQIQTIETKVKEFYVREGLSSAEYESAATFVDEKEARAEAAVDLAEAQHFDCTKVDGITPSNEIKTMHEARKSALDEYRSSLKQLLQIVKGAFTSRSESSKDSV